MASPPPAAAKVSRWGSFLTGLESRLDTILADDESVSKADTEMAASEQVKKKDAVTVTMAQTGSVDGMICTAPSFSTT